MGPFLGYTEKSPWLFPSSGSDGGQCWLGGRGVLGEGGCSWVAPGSPSDIKHGCFPVQPSSPRGAWLMPLSAWNACVCPRHRHRHRPVFPSGSSVTVFTICLLSSWFTGSSLCLRQVALMAHTQDTEKMLTRPPKASQC